jgi:hypothetical protein
MPKNVTPELRDARDRQRALVSAGVVRNDPCGICGNGLYILPWGDARAESEVVRMTVDDRAVAFHDSCVAVNAPTLAAPLGLAELTRSTW